VILSREQFVVSFDSKAKVPAWTAWQVSSHDMGTTERNDGFRSDEILNRYIEVKTPILVDRSLWEASGHWEKFRANMFVAPSDEDKFLAVKPMNCPCHVQIFKRSFVI
jgi:threonyl-tRNA synthetase